MKQMAQEETDKVRKQMQTLEAQLEVLLLPKDPLDERSIMLEVTAANPVSICCTHTCAQRVACACLHGLIRYQSAAKQMCDSKWHQYLRLPQDSQSC